MVVGDVVSNAEVIHYIVKRIMKGGHAHVLRVAILIIKTHLFQVLVKDSCLPQTKNCLIGPDQGSVEDHCRTATRRRHHAPPHLRHCFAEAEAGSENRKPGARGFCKFSFSRFSIFLSLIHI